MSDFANTRSVVVGHFSMYTFNLNLDVLCRVGWGIDCPRLFFRIWRVRAVWGGGLGRQWGVCVCLTNLALRCSAGLCALIWRGVAWQRDGMAWHGHGHGIYI